LGVQLQRLGRHEDALAEYERALALDETSGTAHLDRGLCLVALGRYAEARGPLTRAVELAPDDPFPHKALGALLWNYLGEREEGELELRRFRELGGRDEAVDALLR
jgi:Flp pilus assembly protein TadD